MSATESVRATDITEGTVFKLDGRWVRLVRFEEGWMGRMRFILVAPADVDPRMALVYPKLHRFRTTRTLWSDREYPTREQEAPVWEWIDKKMAADQVALATARGMI